MLLARHTRGPCHCIGTLLRTSRGKPVMTSTALGARRHCATQAPAALPTEAVPDAPLDAALRSVLCSPTAPLPEKHVYQRLTNSYRLVQEFHHSKRTSRLHSQRVALRFLRRHNVLMHGLLFYAPGSDTWNHTAEFSRLALVGEAHLKSEVLARTLRLLPDASASTYAALTRDAAALDSVCALFDDLHMDELVDSPLQLPGLVASPHSRRARRGAPVLTAITKYHMMCATLAEMYWFAARTRGADRVTNNALFPPSDVLILNVLCTHLLETIPAELIHGRLTAPIASIKERWVNKSMSLPSQLRLKPRTLNVHSLSANPHSTPGAERANCVNAVPPSVVAMRALTAEPQFGCVRSVMHPTLDWTKVTRPSASSLAPRPSQLAISPEPETRALQDEPTDLTDSRRQEIYSALS